MSKTDSGQLKGFTTAIWVEDPYDSFSSSVFKKFNQVRLIRRRCWRKGWRMHTMVLHPQKVLRYGYQEFADQGRAECTGCGKTHVILGYRGFIVGADT